MFKIKFGGVGGERLRDEETAAAVERVLAQRQQFEEVLGAIPEGFWCRPTWAEFVNEGEASDAGISYYRAQQVGQFFAHVEEEAAMRREVAAIRAVIKEKRRASLSEKKEGGRKTVKRAAVSAAKEAAFRRKVVQLERKLDAMAEGEVPLCEAAIPKDGHNLYKVVKNIQAVEVVPRKTQQTLRRAYVVWMKERNRAFQYERDARGLFVAKQMASHSCEVAECAVCMIKAQRQVAIELAVKARSKADEAKAELYCFVQRSTRRMAMYRKIQDGEITMRRRGDRYVTLSPDDEEIAGIEMDPENPWVKVVAVPRPEWIPYEDRPQRRADARALKENARIEREAARWRTAAKWRSLPKSERPAAWAKLKREEKAHIAELRDGQWSNPNCTWKEVCRRAALLREERIAAEARKKIFLGPRRPTKQEVYEMDQKKARNAQFKMIREAQQAKRKEAHERWVEMKRLRQEQWEKRVKARHEEWVKRQVQRKELAEKRAVAYAAEKERRLQAYLKRVEERERLRELAKACRVAQAIRRPVVTQVDADRAAILRAKMEKARIERTLGRQAGSGLRLITKDQFEGLSNTIDVKAKVVAEKPFSVVLEENKEQTAVGEEWRRMADNWKPKEPVAKNTVVKLQSKPQRLPKEMARHKHVCVKCKQEYSHVHKTTGEHKQFEFQCPYSTCEWFFRKGNPSQQLNNTRARYVRQVAPKEAQIDSIWENQAPVDEEMAYIFSDTWHNSEYGFSGSMHGVNWSNQSHWNKIETVKLQPWHVEGKVVGNDLRTNLCLKRVKLGDTVSVPILEDGTVKEKFFTVTSFISHRGKAYPAFNCDERLVSGTPIFSKGKLVSCITFSNQGKTYAVVDTERQPPVCHENMSVSKVLFLTVMFLMFSQALASPTMQPTQEVPKRLISIEIFTGQWKDCLLRSDKILANGYIESPWNEKIGDSTIAKCLKSLKGIDRISEWVPHLISLVHWKEESDDFCRKYISGEKCQVPDIDDVYKQLGIIAMEISEQQEELFDRLAVLGPNGKYYIKTSDFHNVCEKWKKTMRDTCTNVVSPRGIDCMIVRNYFHILKNAPKINNDAHCFAYSNREEAQKVLNQIGFDAPTLGEVLPNGPFTFNNTIKNNPTAHCIQKVGYPYAMFKIDPASDLMSLWSKVVECVESSTYVSKLKRDLNEWILAQEVLARLQVTLVRNCDKASRCDPNGIPPFDLFKEKQVLQLDLSQIPSSFAKAVKCDESYFSGEKLFISQTCFSETTDEILENRDCVLILDKEPSSQQELAQLFDKYEYALKNCNESVSSMLKLKILEEQLNMTSTAQEVENHIEINQNKIKKISKAVQNLKERTPELKQKFSEAQTARAKSNDALSRVEIKLRGLINQLPNDHPYHNLLWGNLPQLDGEGRAHTGKDYGLVLDDKQIYQILSDAAGAKEPENLGGVIGAAVSLPLRVNCGQGYSLQGSCFVPNNPWAGDVDFCFKNESSMIINGRYPYEDANCLCNTLHSFTAGVMVFDVIGKNCTNNRLNCIFNFELCENTANHTVEHNSTTSVKQWKQMKINWVLIGTLLFESIVAILIFLWLGPMAAFMWIVCTITISLTTACNVNGHIYEARQDGNERYRISAIWQVGDCFNVENRTYAITQIYKKSVFTLKGEVMDQPEYSVNTTYGCPDGKSDTVCLGKPNTCEGRHQFDVCTHSYNGAFMGTGCFLPGTVYMRSQICVHYASSSRLFVYKNVDHHYLTLSEVIHGTKSSDMLFSDTTLEHSGFVLSNLKFASASVPIYVSEYSDANRYITYDSTMFSSACICNEDKCYTTVADCKPDVRQDGSKLIIDASTPNWKARIGSSDFPELVPGSYWSTHEATLRKDLDYFKGDIIVIPTKTNVVMQVCSNSESESYSVSAGIKYNYQSATVSLVMKSSTNCIIGVSCENCEVVSSRTLFVHGNRSASFSLLCGFSTSANCTLTGKDGKHAMKIDGLFRNPTYLFDKQYNRMVLSLNDSWVESALLQISKTCNTIGDTFKQLFNIPIRFLFRTVAFAIVAYFLIILMMRGYYLPALILAAVALIPVVFAGGKVEIAHRLTGATSCAPRNEAWLIVTIVVCLTASLQSSLPLYSLLYIRGDIMACLLDVVSMIRSQMSDGLDYLRSDYTTVRRRLDLVENLFYGAWFFMYWWIPLVFYLVKYYPKVINYLRFVDTTCVWTELDSTSWIVHRLAILWPKARPTELPDEVIYHNGQRRVLPLSVLIDGLKDYADGKLNIPIFAEGKKKAVFYVSKINGLLIVPKHAIFIDTVGEELTSHNDVVIVGNKESSTRFLEHHRERCLPMTGRYRFTPGDSGLIIYQEDRFYMHSGILSDRTPVCCICHRGAAYYQADKDPKGKQQIGKSKGAIPKVRSNVQLMSYRPLNEQASSSNAINRVSNDDKKNDPEEKAKRFILAMKKLEAQKKTYPVEETRGYVSAEVKTEYGKMQRVNNVTVRKFADVTIVKNPETRGKEQMQRLVNQQHNVKRHVFSRWWSSISTEKFALLENYPAEDSIKCALVERRALAKKLYDSAVGRRKLYPEMRWTIQPEGDKIDFVIETERYEKARDIADISSKIEEQACKLKQIELPDERKAVVVTQKKGLTVGVERFLKYSKMTGLRDPKLKERKDKVERHMGVIDSDDEGEVSDEDELRIVTVCSEAMEFLKETESGKEYIRQLFYRFFNQNGAKNFIKLERELPMIRGAKRFAKDSLDILEGSFYLVMVQSTDTIRTVVCGIPEVTKITDCSPSVDSSEWMFNLLNNLFPETDNVPEPISFLFVVLEKEYGHKRAVFEVSSNSGDLEPVTKALVPADVTSVETETDFVARLRFLIGDIDEFNPSKPILCPLPAGEFVNPQVDPENWVNDRECTWILKIKGMVSGYAYIHRGVALTCTHVVRGGKLIIPFWSDDAGSKLMRKHVSSVPFQISLKNTASFNDSDGDVTIFAITRKEADLATPEVNETHIYIDHDNRRWGTLRCTGSKTLGDEKKFYTFQHVDITKPDCPRISHLTNLKGVSGTPILNRVGRPVGTWGLSCKAEYAEDSIETTLVKADVSTNSQASLLKLACSEVLELHQAAKREGKILRLLAPTGSGKSTRLILETMLNLRRTRVRVSAAVLVPTRDSAERLFNYMSEYVKTDGRYRSVEIRLKHGLIDEQYHTKWIASLESEVKITYQTYGSAVANCAEVIEDHDIIWCDEIHTRDNGQVQAFTAIIDHKQVNKVIALTATAFPSSRYIDHTIQGRNPYTVEEDCFDKWDDSKKDSHIRITSEGESNQYAIPKEVFLEKGRKIVFFPTKNDCVENSTAIRQQLPTSHVAIITSERNDDLTEDSIICATDAIESSATIPGVNLVIDTMTCNRPVTIVNVENTGATVHESMKIRTINSCQQKQRRGRTGRTCKGKYMSPAGKVPEQIEESPIAAIWDAALSLCALNDQDYLGLLKSDNPVISCYRKIRPRVLGVGFDGLAQETPSERYGFDSAPEQVEMLKKRARLVQSYPTIPSLSLYLVPYIPPVLVEYERLFRDTRCTESIVNTWPQTRIVARNDNYMETLRDHGTFIDCRRFFGVLDSMNIDELLEQQERDTQPEVIKKEFGLDSSKLNHNAWYYGPAGASMFAIGVGFLVANQYRSIETGDRVVESILRVPTTTQPDLYNCLRHYAYNDQDYHMCNSRKITGLAKRMFMYGKNKMISAAILVARVIGDSALAERIQNYFRYNQNSDFDLLQIIQHYIEKFIAFANQIDISQYENLGIFSAFPGIALFFQTCAAKYGEWLTTSATAIFAVIACQTIGSKPYAIAAGGVLLLNAIKDKFMLGVEDIDYSSNLAFAMAIVPTGWWLGKNLITQHGDAIANSIKDKDAVVNVINNGFHAESVSAFSLISGSGGADSGYALAISLIDAFRNGMGESTGDRIATISNILMRLWKTPDMTTSGLTVVALTIAVDVIVEKVIAFIEDRPNELGGSLRSATISDSLNQQEQRIRREHQYWIRTTYQVLRVAIGAVVNPISIPFNIINTVLHIVQRRQANLSLSGTEILRIIERNTMLNPVVVCIQTFIMTCNISSEAGRWMDEFSSGSTIQRVIGYNFNSDEGLLVRVIKFIGDSLSRSFNAIKHMFEYVSVKTLNYIFTVLINAIKSIYNGISERISKVKSQISDSLRDILIESLKFNWMMEWFLSSPKNKPKDQIVELTTVTTAVDVLYHLNKYGMSSIARYLERRMHNDPEVQLFHSWFPYAQFKDFSALNLLLELKVCGTPERLIEFKSIVPVSANTRMGKISSDDGYGIICRLLREIFDDLTRNPSIALRIDSVTLDEVINKGRYVCCGTIQDDLYFCYYDCKTKVWFAFFIPMIKELVKHNMYVFTNDSTSQIVAIDPREDSPWFAMFEEFKQKMTPVVNLKSKVDQKVNCFPRTFLFSCLAHCIPSGVLKDKWAVISNMLLRRSILDYYCGKYTTVESVVKATLLTLDVEDFFYSRKLVHCRMEESELESWVRITEVSNLPKPRMMACYQRWDCLSSCSQGGLGLEAFFLRFMRQFKDTRITACLLNILTGKNVYFEHEGKNYVHKWYTKCKRDCHVVIGKGFYYQTEVCKSTPFPAVCMPSNDEVADLRYTTFNDIMAGTADFAYQGLLDALGDCPDYSDYYIYEGPVDLENLRHFQNCSDGALYLPLSVGTYLIMHIYGLDNELKDIGNIVPSDEREIIRYYVPIEDVLEARCNWGEEFNDVTVHNYAPNDLPKIINGMISCCAVKKSDYYAVRHETKTIYPVPKIVALALCDMECELWGYNVIMPIDVRFKNKFYRATHKCNRLGVDNVEIQMGSEEDRNKYPLIDPVTLVRALDYIDSCQRHNGEITPNQTKRIGKQGRPVVKLSGRIDVSEVIKSEKISIFAKLPGPTPAVENILGDSLVYTKPSVTVLCIVGDQEQVAAAKYLAKESRSLMTDAERKAWKGISRGVFGNKIKPIEYRGVEVDLPEEIGSIDERVLLQGGTQALAVDPKTNLDAETEVFNKTELTFFEKQLLKVKTQVKTKIRAAAKDKMGKVLEFINKQQAKELVENEEPSSSRRGNLFSHMESEFLNDLRVPDNSLVSGSRSSSEETIWERNVFDLTQLNQNSKESALTKFTKWIFKSGEKENKLAAREVVRNYQKTDEFQNMPNSEYFIHQKLTKKAVEAIVASAPQEPNVTNDTLASIAHFDGISHRRLINKYDDKLQKVLCPENKEAFPQGYPLIPLSESTFVPEPIKVDEYQDQKLTTQLDGMVKGHVWDVMKRYGRVYLPDNNMLSTISLGYAKANMLDRDTAVFYTARNILDLSAGAGGFIHYVATINANEKVNYVFTTLSRAGHVNVNLDPLYAAINKSEQGRMKIRKIEYGNGDFRYKGVYDIAKDLKLQYDLLISDCGEASSNLDKESKWLTTAHPIQDSGKRDLLHKTPFGAITRYLELLRNGGTFVIKLMGYRKATLNVVRDLSRHFSKLIAYKMPTSSYQSREWYLICMGKREKAGNSFPNIENWFGHVKYIWLQKFHEYYNWVRDNHKIFEKDLKMNGPDGFGLGLDTRERTVDDILKEINDKDTHVHHCDKCGTNYAHTHPHRNAGHRQFPFQCPNKDCDWYYGKKESAKVVVYQRDMRTSTTSNIKVVFVDEKSYLEGDKIYYDLRRIFSIKKILEHDEKNHFRVFKTTSGLLFVVSSTNRTLRDDIMNMSNRLTAYLEAANLTSFESGVFPSSSSDARFSSTLASSSIHSSSSLDARLSSTLASSSIHLSSSLAVSPSFPLTTSSSVAVSSSTATSSPVTVSSSAATSSPVAVSSSSPATPPPTAAVSSSAAASSSVADFSLTATSPSPAAVSSSAAAHPRNTPIAKGAIRISVSFPHLKTIDAGFLVDVLAGIQHNHIYELYVDDKAKYAYKSLLERSQTIQSKIGLNPTKSRVINMENFVSRTKIKQRVRVPTFSYYWKKPDNTWIKLGPDEISQRLKESTVTENRAIPFPASWTRFGETFYPDMDRRWIELKALINQRGYHVLPPTQKFEKIFEVGRVSFKEKYGKEKHTANMVIADMMFDTFGLTPETSVIGHTQCTAEHIRAAHKKRLDLDPIEPNDADAETLLAASIANCTPEYWKIANGPEELKFKPWTYEQTCLEINNQGAGGHFDQYQKFKDAVADPQFKIDVEKRFSDLMEGRPVPAYQTCRDKRETKAKKCINADAELVVPEDLDVHSKKYERLNAASKKERREARRQFLKESARISPRNIRYAEFVQRFVDLMIYGPYQKHHNDKEKMYMGSTTGTPLWKMGDLMRAIWEVYCPDEDREFMVGDKIIETSPQAFPKEFLKANAKRNVKIELMSDVHAKNVLQRIEQSSKSLIASGDFSGWDGTLNNTDHVLELLHHKRVYQKKYHALLKNRMTLYMFSFTITDQGNILCGRGQRGSGDQLTSSGNTFHNDTLHVGSAATALGISCEEVCRPIAIVHYRVDFGSTPYWKKYYVRRISNTADGDDNNHFGVLEDIRKLDVTGIRFIERCGKKIRCGTRAGYDIADNFSGLNFCSHSFIRVRKQVNGSGQKLVNQTSPVLGDRPKRIGEAPKEDDPKVKEARRLCAPFLSKDVSWSLVHQRIYDALNYLTVTYLPKRPLPEIMGKLTYTIKNDVISFSFNRDYGKTTAEIKRAAKNERAFDITRGKALAYLLNYIHIESVRMVIYGIMSVIGDGTCDLSELKRRFSVPSTTSSLLSAMKSIFEIDNIDQIETIPREYDRRGLRSMRRNSQQVFETCKVQSTTSEWAICPTDPVELKTRIRSWVFKYCDKQQIKPDDFWLSLLTSEKWISKRTERSAQTSAPPKTRSMMGNVIASLLNVFTMFSIVTENMIVCLSADLQNVKEVESKYGVVDLRKRLAKKLVFRPQVGDTIVVTEASGQKILCLFVNKNSTERVYSNVVNKMLEPYRHSEYCQLSRVAALKKLNLRKIKLGNLKLC